MYLIPLDNDVIYYNATAVDASALSSVFLVAIAYHPTYNSLLYLIYTCSLCILKPFKIMVRDAAAKEFRQNATIS